MRDHFPHELYPSIIYNPFYSHTYFRMTMGILNIASVSHCPQELQGFFQCLFVCVSVRTWFCEVAGGLTERCFINTGYPQLVKCAQKTGLMYHWRVSYRMWVSLRYVKRVSESQFHLLLLKYHTFVQLQLILTQILQKYYPRVNLVLEQQVNIHRKTNELSRCTEC